MWMSFLTIHNEYANFAACHLKIFPDIVENDEKFHWKFREKMI